MSHCQHVHPAVPLPALTAPPPPPSFKNKRIKSALDYRTSKKVMKLLGTHPRRQRHKHVLNMALTRTLQKLHGHQRGIT